MNDKRINQYLVLPDNGQRKDTKLAVEYDEEQIANYLKQGYVIVNHDDFNKLIGNADGEYLIADDGVVYPSQHLPMRSCWKPLNLLKSQILKLSVTAKRLSLLPTKVTLLIMIAKRGNALVLLLLHLMCRELMLPLIGLRQIMLMLE